MSDETSVNDLRLKQFRSRLALKPSQAEKAQQRTQDSALKKLPPLTSSTTTDDKTQAASRGLLFTVTESTISALDDFVATKHRAGEYSIRRQTILVGALEAYIDEGMVLSVDEVGPGQRKKRLPLRVTPELHTKYMTVFKDFGRRKSIVFERALLTYLRNGLSPRG